MLAAEQNRRLTEVGADTPAGALLRRYWQPVGLVDDFAASARPLRPVRVLAEDLVLFRTEAGGYALIGRHCPHRGADLRFGRLEAGGLRCAVHGWLLDGQGRCRETPAEPAGSTLNQRIRHSAYPCVARNGVVFAYLGPGEPPAFPNLDCFAAPDAYSFAFKGFVDCNWLQVLEIGIDPAHASYLHRFLRDEDPDAGYGLQFRDAVAGGKAPMTRILREFTRPDIQVEETDFGLRLVTSRNLENQGMHVRVTNQVFPQAIVIPMSQEMTITQWHVPVDDQRSYWYAMFTSFRDPVDKARMRAQRLELYELPDYTPKIGKANDYGYDPAEQDTETYTGMGHDINVHDQWAVESMGAIQDRTAENLGRSDIGIAAYRRLLRNAIDRCEKGGQDLPLPSAAGHEVPIAIDAIAPIDDWQTAWRDLEAARRAGCRWLKSTKA